MRGREAARDCEGERQRGIERAGGSEGLRGREAARDCEGERQRGIERERGKRKEIVEGRWEGKKGSSDHKKRARERGRIKLMRGGVEGGREEGDGRILAN